MGLITRQAEFKECDVTTCTCSTAHPGQQNPAQHLHVLLSTSQHAPQASITPEHHPVFTLCRQQGHHDGAEVQVEVCSFLLLHVPSLQVAGGWIDGVYPPCSSFQHCVPGIPKALGHVYGVPHGNYPGATHRVSSSYTNTGSTRRSPAQPLATQGTRSYPQFTFTHNCPLVNFSLPWQTDLRCYVKH